MTAHYLYLLTLDKFFEYFKAEIAREKMIYRGKKFSDIWKRIY